MQQKDDLGTIDVSLTSINSRLPNITRTLASICDQSHSDLRIHLYLSTEPFLLDDGVKELPPELVRFKQEAQGKLRIEFVPNWGPYRKLLPFLQANWDRDGLVVTADDDTIYPRDWLQRLINGYRAHGCSIAYRGHPIVRSEGRLEEYRKWIKARCPSAPDLFLLPTGKDGILYRIRDFPETILDIDSALTVAPTADDIWFRWHLIRAGIPVRILNPDHRAETFEETGSGKSLFRRYNRKGGNDETVARMQEFFRSRYGLDVFEPAIEGKQAAADS